MRIAWYSDNGMEQVVLTPEGKYETAIINSIETKIGEVRVTKGQFAECQGGWIRHYDVGNSLIIYLKKKEA